MRLGGREQILPAEQLSLAVGIFLDERADSLADARRLIEDDRALRAQIREERLRLPRRLRLRERQDGERADALHRALRPEVILAQRVDLLVEELHAHRRRAVHGEYVHDAAARAELAHGLDLLDALVAETGEPLDEMREAERLPRAQAQRKAGEVAARHTLCDGGAREREHDELFAAHEAAEHIHAARRALAPARRGAELLAGRIDFRQLEHRHLRQQPREILAPVLKTLLAVHDDDRRPRCRGISCGIDRVLLRARETVDERGASLPREKFLYLAHRGIFPERAE